MYFEARSLDSLLPAESRSWRTIGIALIASAIVGAGEPSSPVEDEFVAIPSGCFRMGEDDTSETAPASPRHEVCLKAFRIRARLVTQEDFSLFGGRPLPGDGCAQCPVQGVSWEDADRICRNVGLQLPTEAQWEYAARAGDTGHLVWKDTALAKASGWRPGGIPRFKESVPGLRNGWGVQELFIATEWTRDWMSGYPKWRQVDPVGVTSGDRKVVRGAPPSRESLPRYAWRAGRPPSATGSFAPVFRCVEETR